eukprot:3624645-Rhodomonas_salina.1
MAFWFVDRFRGVPEARSTELAKAKSNTIPVPFVPGTLCSAIESAVAFGAQAGRAHRLWDGHDPLPRQRRPVPFMEAMVPFMAAILPLMDAMLPFTVAMMPFREGTPACMEATLLWVFCRGQRSRVCSQCCDLRSVSTDTHPMDQDQRRETSFSVHGCRLFTLEIALQAEAMLTCASRRAQRTARGCR